MEFKSIKSVSFDDMVLVTGANSGIVSEEDIKTVLHGDRGPEGPRGDKGDKGDTGSRGPEGPRGKTGESAFDIAKKTVIGNTWANEKEWIASIKGEKGATGDTGDPGKQGPEGKSAYELAVLCTNFSGSVEDWLKSLQGKDGSVSFDQLTPEQAAMLKGNDGSVGQNGKSAYEIAQLCTDFSGSVEDWLSSLKGQKGDNGDTGPEGKSAYELAVLCTNFSGSVEDWLSSLKGESGETLIDFQELTEEQRESIRGPQGISGLPGKSAYEIACELCGVQWDSEAEWMQWLTQLGPVQYNIAKPNNITLNNVTLTDINEETSAVNDEISALSSNILSMQSSLVNLSQSIDSANDNIRADKVLVDPTLGVTDAKGTNYRYDDTGINQKIDSVYNRLLEKTTNADYLGRIDFTIALNSNWIDLNDYFILKAGQRYLLKIIYVSYTNTAYHPYITLPSAYMDRPADYPNGTKYYPGCIENNANIFKQGILSHACQYLVFTKDKAKIAINNGNNAGGVVVMMHVFKYDGVITDDMLQTVYENDVEYKNAPYMFCPCSGTYVADDGIQTGPFKTISGDVEVEASTLSSGTYMFYNCENISSIKFPNLISAENLSHICNSISSLTCVEFPVLRKTGIDGLKSAFAGNVNLKSIELPMLEQLEAGQFSGAFLGNTGISSSPAFLKKFEYIPEKCFYRTFYGNKNLKTADFDQALTAGLSSFMYAFQRTQATSVNFKNLISAGDASFVESFKLLDSISTVYFDNLQSIGRHGMDSAFSQSDVKYIDFPKLKFVDEYGLDGAFANCVNMQQKNIEFPNLISAGNYAYFKTFLNTGIAFDSSGNSLTKIQKNKTKIQVDFPVLTAAGAYCFSAAFGGCDNISGVYFPSLVQAGEKCFSAAFKKTYITNIEFPMLDLGRPCENCFQEAFYNSYIKKLTFNTNELQTQVFSASSFTNCPYLSEISFEQLNSLSANLFVNSQFNGLSNPITIRLPKLAWGGQNNNAGNKMTDYYKNTNNKWKLPIGSIIYYSDGIVTIGQTGSVVLS